LVEREKRKEGRREASLSLTLSVNDRRERQTPEYDGVSNPFMHPIRLQMHLGTGFRNENIESIVYWLFLLSFPLTTLI
jgi:hypothetical protein